jgi:hypothetical protein
MVLTVESDREELGKVDFLLSGFIDSDLAAFSSLLTQPAQSLNSGLIAQVHSSGLKSL